MRVLPAALTFALTMFAIGCGEASPPSRAASERQITRTVLAFNELTMAGEGEAACRLKVDHSLKGLGSGPRAPGVHDCATFWTWIGPKLGDSTRQIALNDRVARVSVSDTDAVATMTSGARLTLTWNGGRWKLK